MASRYKNLVHKCKVCGREFHPWVGSRKCTNKYKAKYCGRVCNGLALRSPGGYKIRMDKGGHYTRHLVYRPDLGATVNGWVAPGRAAVADFLGRPVRHGEFVIHVNYDPADARLSNLFLCSRSYGGKVDKGSEPHPRLSNLAGMVIVGDHTA